MLVAKGLSPIPIALNQDAVTLNQDVLVTTFNGVFSSCSGFRYLIFIVLDIKQGNKLYSYGQMVKLIIVLI
jgi:hypothetical protein